MELTILMPCLNEAETIEVCVTKAMFFLNTMHIDGEVLIADNGSTDGSPDLARALGARVVDIDERGYGAALIGGIEAARGEFVIMGDSDDSYDFLSLQPFVDELRAGNDLVMGNRFTGGIEPGAMPRLHRLLGNPVLSMIGRRCFQIPVGDFHCGLRGFRRESAMRLGLNCTGMEFASELVVKSKLAGQRIVEVPTVLHPDGRSRPPHLRSWHDGWRHLRFLLLFSPRWLFLNPGLIAFTVGLIVSSALAVGPLHLFGIVFDVNTLVAAVGLTLAGSQALWFAVLSKSFATREGLLPPDPRIDRLRRTLTLERALLAGAACCVAGVVGAIVAVSRWRLDAIATDEWQAAIRLTIISVGVFLLGAQICLGALLESVLALPRSRRGGRVELDDRAETPVSETQEPDDSRELTGTSS